MDLKQPPVLLLDLDGVIVFEPRGGGPAPQEILLLHADLPALIAAWRAAVVVVTHRSRREAVKLIRAAGIAPDDFTGIVTAEEILRQGIAQGRWGELAREGLKKSLVLAHVERLTNRARSEFVVIDDRDHNVDAMLQEGVGFAVKAPSGLADDQTALTTFDLGDVFRVLDQGLPKRHSGRCWHPAPISAAIQDWQRTGESTGDAERDAFNRLRRFWYGFRTSGMISAIAARFGRRRPCMH